MLVLGSRLVDIYLFHRCNIQFETYGGTIVDLFSFHGGKLVFSGGDGFYGGQIILL